MFLYNLTLQRATGITHAVHGSFSGKKQQEILVSRGKCLELLRPDPNTGKVHSLLTVEIFGVIRSLMAFRLTGGNKDYAVVGSDSGRIVILEYNPQKNVLEKVHQETFGKSGCRRIVPGQYLAVDPKARAIMVGAIEKQKVVYILNRDAEARLTISSPLEAHKSNTLVYHMVGLDVGFENSIFACLEIDYEESDNDATWESANETKQSLTFYEQDYGVNHVVRKYSEPLEEHANFLISVPGGDDGPSGVLICSENYLTYKNLGEQHDIRCPIPRRRNDLDDPERGMIFVCSATHKTKSMFFFLVQTEQGDIFKVTLETDEEVVTEIKLKYFDTVPVAAAMCVLKTGFLFVASEFGNHAYSMTFNIVNKFMYILTLAHHVPWYKVVSDGQQCAGVYCNPWCHRITLWARYIPRPSGARRAVTTCYLYQIAHLGDDDDEPEFSSAMPLEEGDTFFFAPRPLRNLVLVDEMDSLSPILDCHVADLANEDTPQLYMACGRGPRSTLRVLRHGLEVSEMAVSELPGSPNAVWTVKKRATDEYDAYIVVSFLSATLVLSIGETVEEVADSGFLGFTLTLACSALGDDAAVQVYPGGVRHIRSDKRLQDWKVPGKKQIVKCAVNRRQVVIALTGGELVYFEMDPTGQLKEYNQWQEMQCEVVCMALGNAPSGEQMSRFVAVGLADNTVRIISLDPQDCLQMLCTQAVPAAPESLCIVEMGGGDGGRSTLYLNIGLHNGGLLRTVLDPVTGDLADTRTRYLGTRPVKLFPITMQGSQAVIAMSSRTWLSYCYQGRFHLTPLSYDSLEYASGFASEQCPEGIVAISTNTLRILALEKLGAVFNQVSFPLEYTPRKFVVHPESKNLIIIETEHNAYTEETKKQRRIQMAKEMEEAAGEEEMELAKEMAQDFLSEDLPERVFGAPKAGAGMWASLVRIMSPGTGTTHSLLRLEQNEAAISLAVVKFSNQPENQQFLVVGIAKDYQLNPRQISSGYLNTYRIVNNGCGLELVHRTQVDELPTAICAFHGRILVGVGKLLRLYDLGKKKLLRKCENKHIPNMIVRIEAMGRRVYVSDVQESVFMVRYKSAENQLIIFADDTQPRWITTTTILDYNTVATADKFGNIAVIRLASNVTDDVDEDPTGNKALWDRGLLNGASQKADFVANFHVGEVVTSLQKATLIPGGSESLVYTTLSGTVGVLVPFTSHEDQDFFQHLEMHMRSEAPPLCGRDHLSFRSYYFPVKNVIDGDLCEQFTSLEAAKQKSIAEDLDRTPNEVSKKLEDIRTSYAF